MQQMYQVVSAAIGNADMRATILAIQKRLGNPVSIQSPGDVSETNIPSQDVHIVHSKRRFIGEGRLHMRSDKLGKKKRRRDIFLFNDIMLITKLKGKSYKCYNQINLYVSALHEDEGAYKQHSA